VQKVLINFATMATTQASLFDFGVPDESGKQDAVSPEIPAETPVTTPADEPASISTDQSELVATDKSLPTVPETPELIVPETPEPVATANVNVQFEEVNSSPNEDNISDEALLARNYVSNDFLPAEDIDLKTGGPAADLKSVIDAVKNPPTTLPERKSTRGRMKLSDMNTGADLIEIPDDDELFQKSYYPIGAVSEMFKVNISLIRFWENEFDILKPRKNGKGDRHFRPEDVKNLKLIYHLLREKKYTIEGAKDFLKKNKKVEETFSVIESLKKMKAFLNEIRASL
jgi:DNA-binding transcriptional MerR regulator